MAQRAQIKLNMCPPAPANSRVGYSIAANGATRIHRGRSSQCVIYSKSELTDLQMAVASRDMNFGYATF